MRKVVFVFLLVCASVSLVGCGHSASIPKGAAVVDIKQMAFRPQVIHVVVGQTVAWRFQDAGVVHNVTGEDGSAWHSPNKDSGIWVHTFTSAGVFHYRCTLHQLMTGEVVVDS